MELGDSRVRVHIVDDDPSFTTAMARRLKQAGYNVATYTSAEQLLDRLPTGNEPSCIILDVRMPGLDGPALQKRLSELGSTMPIVFLTAYADTRTVVQTLKAGALDFLTKPVASHDVLAAVATALRHHQAWLDQRRPLDGIRARLARPTLPSLILVAPCLL